MSWMRALSCLTITAMLSVSESVLAQPSAADLAALPNLHDQTQRVVLLTPTLDAYSVQELIRALASLGVRGMTIRDAQLDPALEACGTFSCLAQVARATEGRAALVSVSSGDDGVQTLLLVLVDADGSNAQTRTRVAHTSLVQALITAWKEASLSLALEGQSMIQAESRPSGARVWFDGAPVGSTPFARQVAPGRHRIKVELDGFTTQEREIEARAGRVQRFHVTLERAPRFDARSLTGTPITAPSPWNFALGGALALVAAPALIASVNALANDGQCLQRRADGGCRQRARFDTQSAYLFTFGVVALGTGGTLLLVHPIDERFASTR